MNRKNHPAEVKYLPIASFAMQLQENRLAVRRDAVLEEVEVAGTRFIVLPGVYDCGGDTTLMIETVTISKYETFLDVGCGAGAVSVCMGAASAGGRGVDINPTAVKNATLNAANYGIRNVTFSRSDVFDSVAGRYDVIVCNPPYTPCAAKDAVDKMFWDPANGMSRRFFARVREYLVPGGRLYFGWADLPDLNSKLPEHLAKLNGMVCKGVASKKMRGGQYNYYVYLFSY